MKKLEIKSFLAICFVLLTISVTVIAQDEVKEEKETPPEGGTPKDFSLPEKKVVNLENGLKLVMVQYGQIPKATISIVTKTGNINESADQVWLSDIMADLMKEGSQNMNGDQIANKIAGMGGELNINVSMHTTTAGASVLYEFVPEAVSIVADVVMNPAFPEDELGRLINDRKRSLNVSLSRAQPQARAAFMAAVYPDHPYGRVYPTEDMLSSYTIEDVKSFYENNFGAKRTTVYVVGKFDESKVENVVKESMSGWKSGPETNYPVAEPQVTDIVSVTNRADAPQSTIMFGIPVANPSSEDWVALNVTNSLLGGSFGSRITRNIREDKGYTYSPRSVVNSNYKSAIWYEIADVTTDVTQPSLEEITKEIYRLQDEAPSEEELDGIKNYGAGIFVLQNSTPGGIIGQLVNMDVHDLDDSYLTNYVQNIYAVTPEKVKEITQKYIKPEDMTLVVVGDKEKIEKQVEAFDKQRESLRLPVK
ncbi:M16 family metallopeptidase [Marinigracilibium pacificum]|uniref:Insulinase family protein n=1 Tax=Marinigracilibium pacificum TaxID=2729599 RepID=A0A848IXZ7_9BACT|nr:pitrilysin family protein [Marinigracilibium pacificum]NMM48506.1 insulinase family protein [Marinigracilibium pacificum]